MFGSLDLWIEYLVRFSHVVAGIAWIGSSFYFIWLDSAFLPPKQPRHNVDGEVFMVHGGFYYQVEKKKIAPGELPEHLHWFKWEATLTWITGFLLLVILYFMRGASLLIDPMVHSMTQFQAVGLTLAVMTGAWLTYDCLWNDRFISNKTISGILSLLFFGGLIYFSLQLFSGRGAFIVLGGTFATLMLLNVWIRILPGQTKIVNAAKAGEMPDYSVGIKSKVRSVHNTYFTFPVLFMMLSNHYPSIYNHNLNWLLLIILSVAGAMVRHVMVTNNPKERYLLLPASAGLVALVFMTANKPNPAVAAIAMAPVSYERVHKIIKERCLSCHSTANTDDIFKEAPLGMVFESESQVLKVRDRVLKQVVETRAMPLMNKTQMTEDERQIINQYLSQ